MDILLAQSQSDFETWVRILLPSSSTMQTKLYFCFFILIAFFMPLATCQLAPVAQSTYDLFHFLVFCRSNLSFRAETWAVNIANRFSLVEEELIMGDKMRDAYLKPTQIATPIVGQQQVALLAVRLSTVLEEKVQILEVKSLWLCHFHATKTLLTLF